jgi:hypothetical protein
MSRRVTTIGITRGDSAAPTILPACLPLLPNVGSPYGWMAQTLIGRRFASCFMKAIGASRRNGWPTAFLSNRSVTKDTIAAAGDYARLRRNTNPRTSKPEPNSTEVMGSGALKVALYVPVTLPFIES